MTLYNMKHGTDGNDDRAISFELTLGTGDDKYVPIPWDSSLIKAWTAIDDAITTANETVVLFDASGNTAGTITVTQASSTAGDVDSVTPTSNNVFSEGDAMKITIGGESGGCSATLVCVFRMDQGV